MKQLCRDGPPLGRGVHRTLTMFVRPEYRRNGFSKTILVALEEIARGRGYRTIFLETGVNQPAAIALYERAGYKRIPCYGEFVSNKLSCCFEKRLEHAAES